MRKQVVLSAMVAVLSSAVTTGIWASITPASAAGSKVMVIKDLTFFDSYSGAETVDPGHTDDAVADCPAGMDVIGGGYHITGTNGLTVASAVDSFPEKGSESPQGFYVEVVNPDIAHGPVEFSAKAKCMGEEFRSVSP
jgi:hypothetical protein